MRKGRKHMRKLSKNMEVSNGIASTFAINSDDGVDE